MNCIADHIAHLEIPLYSSGSHYLAGRLTSVVPACTQKACCRASANGGKLLVTFHLGRYIILVRLQVRVQTGSGVLHRTVDRDAGKEPRNENGPSAYAISILLLQDLPPDVCGWS